MEWRGGERQKRRIGASIIIRSQMLIGWWVDLGGGPWKLLALVGFFLEGGVFPFFVRSSLVQVIHFPISLVVSFRFV